MLRGVRQRKENEPVRHGWPKPPACAPSDGVRPLQGADRCGVAEALDGRNVEARPAPVDAAGRHAGGGGGGEETDPLGAGHVVPRAGAEGLKVPVGRGKGNDRTERPPRAVSMRTCVLDLRDHAAAAAARLG